MYCSPSARDPGPLRASGRRSSVRSYLALAVGRSDSRLPNSGRRDLGWHRRVWAANWRGTPHPESDAGLAAFPQGNTPETRRSEEHTSELQSLMRISYAVFCFKKKTITTHHNTQTTCINH